MSEHRANLHWERGSQAFTYESYGRDHVWRFPGGVEVPASSAPEFRGNPACVDPEAALVAALSSCHMLTFLAIAARKRLVVDSYGDDAVGYLEKNADGKLAVTRVVLRPKVVFGEGTSVSKQDLDRLHHRSHEECFIANSVKTEVTVEPA
ncbi:MAG: OsmC family protein [Deltaproteobacteria bacterium]|nr:OsmC family protein [Deltaproteobacteria bacterium]